MANEPYYYPNARVVQAPSRPKKKGLDTSDPLTLLGIGVIAWGLYSSFKKKKEEEDKLEAEARVDNPGSTSGGFDDYHYNLALQAKRAMAAYGPWNTDEDALYDVAAKVKNWAMLQKAYKTADPSEERSLLDRIEYELDEEEYQKFNNILRSNRTTTTKDGKKVTNVDTNKAIYSDYAKKFRDNVVKASNWWARNTPGVNHVDEEAAYKLAREIRGKNYWNGIKGLYLQLYGTELTADMQNGMSDSEWEKFVAILNNKVK